MELHHLLLLLSFSLLQHRVTSSSLQQAYTFTDFLDPPDLTLAAGAPHTCHVNASDNSLRCWTGNAWRQAQQLPMKHLVQISCGRRNCCGIHSSPPGKVSCWSVPAGDVLDSADQHWEMLQVAVGDGFSCAITSEDHIRCWGEQGRKMEEAALKALTASPLVQLSCSTTFCCVLSVSGVVECFGEVPAAMKDMPVIKLKQIACSNGGSHTVGITMLGEFLCWGDDAFGQCRNPHKRRYVKVVAGERFTCGLTHEGGLLCWGKTPRMQATETFRFKDVNAGERHICGVFFSEQSGNPHDGVVCFT